METVFGENKRPTFHVEDAKSYGACKEQQVILSGETEGIMKMQVRIAML